MDQKFEVYKDQECKEFQKEVVQTSSMLYITWLSFLHVVIWLCHFWKVLTNPNYTHKIVLCFFFSSLWTKSKRLLPFWSNEEIIMKGERYITTGYVCHNCQWIHFLQQLTFISLSSFEPHKNLYFSHEKTKVMGEPTT